MAEDKPSQQETENNESSSKGIITIIIWVAVGLLVVAFVVLGIKMLNDTNESGGSSSEQKREESPAEKPKGSAKIAELVESGFGASFNKQRV